MSTTENDSQPTKARYHFELPAELKQRMAAREDVNWSGFLRISIENKLSDQNYGELTHEDLLEEIKEAGVDQLPTVLNTVLEQCLIKKPFANLIQYCAGFCSRWKSK